MLYPIAARADVMFSDATFNDADWQITSFVGHPSAGVFVSNPAEGSASGDQQPTGGSPGPYRRTTLVLNSSVNANVVAAFHMRVGATYDPAVSGAIDQISFAENCFTQSSTNPSSTGQLTGPAFIQGGVVFCAREYEQLGSATGAFPWPSPWFTHGAFLIARDFCAMPEDLGNGACNTHPNFSSSGQPITFGFMRTNSQGAGGGGGYTTVAGIDLWKIRVFTARPQAPAATGWGMFLMGLLMATAGVVAFRSRHWSLP